MSNNGKVLSQRLVRRTLVMWDMNGSLDPRFVTISLFPRMMIWLESETMFLYWCIISYNQGNSSVLSILF